MNERERLIDLLNDIQRCGEDYTEYERYGINYPDTVSNENVADHLLANGVTVSQQTEPKTNGDRIRAMNDEELADTWMRDFVVCHRCAYRYECECDEYVTIEKCREGIVEWLKQPLEEEK